MLKRLFETLRTRNWSSLGLELLVVIIGIFLAIQIDRWYENKQLKATQSEHLRALAVDFAANRVSLERYIGLHRNAVDASVALISLNRESGGELSNSDFYDLVRQVQYMGSGWGPQRRAYDVLVSSGQIEALEDDKLRADLSEYFSLAARAEHRHSEMMMQRVTTLEPYMNEHLDHAALVLKVHPEITEALTTSLQSEQFLEVLGTQKFKGVIATKMHASHDATNYLSRLLELNIEIEDQLVKVNEGA